MSFVKRQINLQFSGAESGNVNLEGLRCHAIVFNPGGDNAVAQLTLKVYGMTLDQMNAYSAEGSNLLESKKYSVTVLAGDEGNTLLQVFSGYITSSYIDFSSAPDVSFDCVASSGFFEQIVPVAPNSYQGIQKAEDIIKSLTESMGPPWSFQNYNNNAHAVIYNQYLSGSIIDQIFTIAKAACFPIKIENNTVYIWPNGNNVDGVVIDVSAETGLVGYPTYITCGFAIKTQFNAAIANGRKIKLKSVIIKANGMWSAHVVTHELSTLMPDGPWFTNCNLNKEGSDYVARN